MYVNVIFMVVHNSSQCCIDLHSTCIVSVLQKKLENIEISLKQVSISNQKERQGLASSLRQTTSSSNTNPGDIKEKLIDLTKRQKTLLSCFKKQTELMKLVEQIKSTVNATDTAVAMETDNPVTEENPFVTKGTDLAVETGVPSLMSVLSEEPTPVPGTGPIPIVIIPNENRLIPPSSLSLLSQSQSDTVLCSTSDNNETPFSNTHTVSVYKQKIEQGATNISNYSSQPVVLAGSNPLEPAATTNTTTEQLPTTQPSFDLDHFLKNCLVIPHQLPKQSTSLSLPKDFWGSWSFDSLSLSLAYKHIEDELTNWS